MRRLVLAAAVLCWAACVLAADAAFAQQGQTQGTIGGVGLYLSWKQQTLEGDHLKLTGDVELELDGGATKISADQVDIYYSRNLMVATGNVTLTTRTQRISADSLEFDLETKLGTFHHASGNARIKDDPLNPLLGPVAGAAPATTPTPATVSNQFGSSEPDVLFYGETIEKIGDRKYRITNGGFTTCVQPEPRWQLLSGTVVLNIDHYAMLRNMVMNVKGVPLFYLPVLYYPINKDDRATGILMPVYGSSTLRGQTISNAFFWAINRSQDATVMYDWFSKTGSGIGGEYRYVMSPTSTGEFRTYYLSEKPVETTDAAGNTSNVAGRKSFELRGSGAQDLPWHLRARGRVDYFSDITVQQAYNTNIYDASRRSRYFGGSVSGNWKAYSVTGSLDQNQYFFNSTDSTTSGSMPRINFTRGEQPIAGTPIYVGVGTEYVSLVRKTETGTGDAAALLDTGLSRLDLAPSIRYGFTKIPYFNVNTSLAWRYTWWSESLSPEDGLQVAAPIYRTYYDMQARIVGPIFTRIWNTENNFYAEKYKHTIEPWVNLQRVTNFENRDEIVQLDATDSIYGGTTRVTFGINNRIYAKHRAEGGRAREILNVQIQQTYYSDERMSTVDPAYSTSFGSQRPQKLSPVSLAARFTPNEQIGGSFNTSYNTYVNAFLNYAAIGTYAYHESLQVSGGWNQRRYVPGLVGYDNPAYASHFLSADAVFKINKSRFGGAVSFNYDLKNDYFLQSRYVGFYNAQCCGFSFEYQTYDFGSAIYNGVNKDKRFSFAITLAGLGSFSPFFGGMNNPTNQMYR